MDIDHYDFRTGGSYRYTHTAPDGSAYGFTGVFHTVRENDFAIQTFEFDGYPDVVSIESLTFEDLGGGRTRLTAHAVYPSMEARDGMAQSGMEGGLTEGYERLEEVLTGAKVWTRASTSTTAAGHLPGKVACRRRTSIRKQRGVTSRPFHRVERAVSDPALLWCLVLAALRT